MSKATYSQYQLGGRTGMSGAVGAVFKQFKAVFWLLLLIYLPAFAFMAYFFLCIFVWRRLPDVRLALDILLYGYLVAALVFIAQAYSVQASWGGRIFIALTYLSVDQRSEDEWPPIYYCPLVGRPVEITQLPGGWIVSDARFEITEENPFDHLLFLSRRPLLSLEQGGQTNGGVPTGMMVPRKGLVFVNGWPVYAPVAALTVVERFCLVGSEPGSTETVAVVIGSDWHAWAASSDIEAMPSLDKVITALKKAIDYRHIKAVRRIQALDKELEAVKSERRGPSGVRR